MLCPKCGKEIPDKSNFCPYCGASISHYKENKVIEDVSLKKKIPLKLIVLSVIMGTVLLSGVLIYFNFFPRINPEKSSEYESNGIKVLSSIIEEGKINQNEISKTNGIFEKAVKLNPNSISARKNLAYSYLISDKQADAEKQIEEILKIDPENSFALEMKTLLSEEMP